MNRVSKWLFYKLILKVIIASYIRNMPRQTTTRAVKNDDLGPAEKTAQDSIAVSTLEDVLDRKLASLKDDLATKDDIKDLKDVIKDQKSKIDALESRIVLMEKYMKHLERASDEQEQYQRRICLRLNSVEVEEGANETSEECIEMVKETFQEIYADVPDSVIDRVHRIGRPIEKNGKRYRQVIIRFTSWRHRTAAYKARKKSQKYRFQLDLTKRRVKPGL